MNRTQSIKCFMLLFFIWGMVAWAQAQPRQISGRVTSSDDGLPLPGVSVIIEGTTQGTISDVDGNFSLSAAPDDRLAFSFIGFETQIIQVGNQTIFNMVLMPMVSSLDEVVVVGYGTSRVRDLTSAITTISADELSKTPAGQAMQGLQGRVAGLQVVSSGAPGASPTIRVRGIGSYPGRGNEDPLYVVDGMFFDNIDFLNPSDIASISVLKDASAAAIYGVRAANGVILIETKSGRLNQKGEIVYDGYYGMQVAQNVLKMANAEQFTTMAMESGSPADISYIQNAMQRYGRSRINPNVPDVNTDWYNEILRPAAIQNHSLTVNGGSESATYSIGANYFFQEGILDMKNDYERFNLRSKIDYKANDWLDIGANMMFSNAFRNLEAAGAWHTAYYAVPIMPVFDELNQAAWPKHYSSAQLLGYRDGKNPFPEMDFSENSQKIRKLNANFYAELTLIPQKLAFRTNYNHAFTALNQRNIALPYFLSNNAQRENSVISRYASNWSNQIWDNFLTFTNSFGGHNLVVMAGTSFRDEAYDHLRGQGINFPYGQKTAWYISQAEEKPETGVGDDGLRQYGLSYISRVSYNYNNKYLIYGTMRADGSSKYQEKWGYFPSVGVGWIPSEEAFMEGVDAVDFLKLRASWGRLGNDKIQASDGARTTSVVYTSINDQYTAGTIATSTYSELKWELTEETNIGLDAQLFNTRLSVNTEYFIRDTKNAAVNVTIPSVGATVLRNVGEIRNSGFEFALNWRDDLTNDWSYTIGANFSTLKNEVRDLFGQPYIDGGSAEFRQRSIVGEPLLAFYGWEVVGVYQNEAQVQSDPIAVANNLVPGDFIYKDQNGDGVIDDNDRKILGSYFPNFMYGANLGLKYRNLDLSVTMMGQSGNKILNRKRGEMIWTNDGNLDADLAKNRWHGEGTSNKYPSSAGLRKGWNQKMSTYFVEDGSFFRIQNIQLGYNINTRTILGEGMPQTRVTFTAERPLTWFSYNGFSPEVSDGIDRQTYPIPAVYTIGLNVKF
ncbi:SusC/RagA family TonB-linked outer membrane protein [Alkaliflexus imshenetskii]|uniref:SusC/RagA family TonB-linked outer membrane protein n=1 Tax=Alkaliflexus imshenetskii TaxID=286730 RepID=UPI00047E5996|nr:TonB-dependent receptor [Alkaliflexus imshenetskii]